jgi:hypothetical protein
MFQDTEELACSLGSAQVTQHSSPQHKAKLLLHLYQHTSCRAETCAEQGARVSAHLLGLRLVGVHEAKISALL